MSALKGNADNQIHALVSANGTKRITGFAVTSVSVLKADISGEAHAGGPRGSAAEADARTTRLICGWWIARYNLAQRAPPRCAFAATH
jgi:hypothetical protein